MEAAIKGKQQPLESKRIVSEAPDYETMNLASRFLLIQAHASDGRRMSDSNIKMIKVKLNESKPDRSSREKSCIKSKKLHSNTRNQIGITGATKNVTWILSSFFLFVSVGNCELHTLELTPSFRETPTNQKEGDRASNSLLVQPRDWLGVRNFGQRLQSPAADSSQWRELATGAPSNERTRTPFGLGSLTWPNYESPLSRLNSSAPTQESLSIGIMIKPEDPRRPNSGRDYQIVRIRDPNRVASLKIDETNRSRRLLRQPDWQATDLSYVIRMASDGRGTRKQDASGDQNASREQANSDKLSDLSSNWQRKDKLSQFDSNKQQAKQNKANEWAKDLAHNKHGWKNLFHREEFAEHRKFHDLAMDRKWRSDRERAGQERDSKRGQEVASSLSKLESDRHRHGSKFDHHLGSDWKRFNSNESLDKSEDDDEDRSQQQAFLAPQVSSKSRSNTESLASAPARIQLQSPSSGSASGASRVNEPSSQIDNPLASSDGEFDLDEGTDEANLGEHEFEQMKQKLHESSISSPTSSLIGNSVANQQREQNNQTQEKRKDPGQRLEASKQANSINEILKGARLPNHKPKESYLQLSLASSHSNQKHDDQAQEDEEEVEDEGEEDSSHSNQTKPISQAQAKLSSPKYKDNHESRSVSVDSSDLATVSHRQPVVSAVATAKLRDTTRLTLASELSVKANKQSSLPAIDISKVIPMTQMTNEPRFQPSASFKYNRNISAETRGSLKAPSKEFVPNEIPLRLRMQGKPMLKSHHQYSLPNKQHQIDGQIGGQAWAKKRKVAFHSPGESLLFDSSFGAPSGAHLRPQFEHPITQTGSDFEMLKAQYAADIDAIRSMSPISDLTIFESAPSPIGLRLSGNERDPIVYPNSGHQHHSSSAQLISSLNDHFRVAIGRRPRFLQASASSSNPVYQAGGSLLFPSRAAYNRMMASIFRVASSHLSPVYNANAFFNQMDPMASDFVHHVGGQSTGFLQYSPTRAIWSAQSPRGVRILDRKPIVVHEQMEPSLQSLLVSKWNRSPLMTGADLTPGSRLLHQPLPWSASALDIYPQASMITPMARPQNYYQPLHNFLQGPETTNRRLNSPDATRKLPNPLGRLKQALGFSIGHNKTSVREIPTRKRMLARHKDPSTSRKSYSDAVPL